MLEVALEQWLAPRWPSNMSSRKQALFSVAIVGDFQVGTVLVVAWQTD